MDQLVDHLDNEDQIENDKTNNNGLIMCDSYIPGEVISQILIQYVDYKSLVNCQVVCKYWKDLIRSYIWRKKSQVLLGEFSHEFYNYGPGLRKIIFQHNGCNRLIAGEHFGSKMTGASVIVRIPNSKKSPPQSTTDN